MSKTYIVSRNGGTVTKAPINDNKIPIYANETALDADLANIPDNTLVATRGGHDDVIDQMKAYIRDQNELSDIESLIIGTSESTATQMQYDGFIVMTTDLYSNPIINISSDNKQTWFIAYGTGIEQGKSNSYLVRKGDYVWSLNGNNANNNCRWYKKRDYTGR